MRNEFFSLLVGVIASSVQRQRLYWQKNGINSYYFPFHLDDEAVVTFTLDSIEIKDITVAPTEIVEGVGVTVEFIGITMNSPIVDVKPTGSANTDNFVEIENANMAILFDSIVISDPVKLLDGAFLDTEGANVSIAFDTVTINDPLKFGNTDTDETTVSITFNSLEIL